MSQKNLVSLLITSSPGRGAKYCDKRVCVCLSVGLSVCPLAYLNKSSAVAEMGDRGQNRHGPGRKSHHTALSNVTVPTSDYPTAISI